MSAASHSVTGATNSVSCVEVLVQNSLRWGRLPSSCVLEDCSEGGTWDEVFAQEATGVLAPSCENLECRCFLYSPLLVQNKRILLFFFLFFFPLSSSLLLPLPLFPPPFPPLLLLFFFLFPHKTCTRPSYPPETAGCVPTTTPEPCSLQDCL